MLNIAETVASAASASKSMPGLSIELIDALTRFSGKDMRELSRICPYEFAQLHDLLQRSRNLLVTVQGLEAESEAL